jgi:hypothetical protein
LGYTQQFQATVLGTVAIPQDVEWTLSGSSGGSFISDTGLLTIGTNETAATLTIKATAKVDSTKSISMTVNVVEKPIVDSVSILPVSDTLPKGGVRQFSAQVIGQNITQKVEWKVEGATSTNTTINANGVLTIGIDETAAEIKIIATTVDKDASGAVVKDEVTVTIAS